MAQVPYGNMNREAFLYTVSEQFSTNPRTGATSWWTSSGGEERRFVIVLPSGYDSAAMRFYYDRRGNTSEEGMKSIKMAAEAGFNCISATVDCQESPDSASTVTFPWAKGARIPRLWTPKGSFWKPWSEGIRVFLLNNILSSEELLFQMISLNFLDKMERSGIMGDLVKKPDSMYYRGCIIIEPFNSPLRECGFFHFHLRSEFMYALSGQWPRPGPKGT